ncbi:hypothetical protein D3C71_1344480 [compost metagenome]
MGCRVAGIGTDGLLQRLSRLALLPLGRIEHRQVVIGFGHAGVLAHQGRKNLDGLGMLFLLAGNHPAQKPHFHIVGILLEIAVGLPRRLFGIALIQQLAHFVHCACGMRGHAAQKQAPTQQNGQQRPRKARRSRTVLMPRNFGCNLHMALFSLGNEWEGKWHRTVAHALSAGLPERTAKSPDCIPRCPAAAVCRVAARPCGAHAKSCGAPGLRRPTPHASTKRRKRYVTNAGRYGTGAVTPGGTRVTTSASIRAIATLISKIIN